MLNAANLNFIAFWRYGEHPEALTGIMFAIFSIGVAAAEAAVAPPQRNSAGEVAPKGDRGGGRKVRPINNPPSSRRTPGSTARCLPAPLRVPVCPP